DEDQRASQPVERALREVAVVADPLAHAGFSDLQQDRVGGPAQGRGLAVDPMRRGNTPSSPILHTIMVIAAPPANRGGIRPGGPRSANAAYPSEPHAVGAATAVRRHPGRSARPPPHRPPAAAVPTLAPAVPRRGSCRGR